MKLFTKDIDNKLFKQYPLGNQLEKQKVVAKIFNPYGQGRWYLLNSDPEDPDYLWAIVQMGRNVEIGSVSRRELETIRVSPFRFPLERDLGFSPVNAYELWKGLGEGKFYKDGGWVNNENKEMLENQAVEIEHHAEELEDVLPKVKEVEPWVVAKAERAATDLSDLTHYLDGESRRPEMKEEVEEMSDEIDDFDRGGYMANGGEMHLNISDDERMEIKNLKGLIEESMEAIETHEKLAQKSDDKETKSYHQNKVKKNKEVLANRKSRLEQLTKRRMEGGGSTSSPNIEFMKWFVDWSKSVDKYVDVAISIPNEFSSPKKDDKGEIVILDVIEKKGDTDAKKYLNEILKKADEFGVSIYLQPIPRTHNLKSEEHKKKITKDYLIKYYEKFGFEKMDGGFMVRAPKMAEGGETDKKITFKRGDYFVVLKDMGKLKRFRIWKIEGNYVTINYSKYDGTDVYDSNETKSNLKYLLENGYIKKVNKKEYWNRKYENYAEGGEVKFKDKVASIKASLLKRKKVAKKVQKDYGKTYSPKEAEESAKRIVGAMTAKEKLKMRMAKKKKK